MAKTLLLLRHAKSSWMDSDHSDHERPLNHRGQAAAPQMGRLIAQQDLIPARVVTSDAVRALSTARAVIEATGHAVPLESTRDLYLAPPHAYIEAMRRLDDAIDRVLMVGHNPGIEELVHSLTGRAEPMPTAALAALELPVASWVEVSLDMRPRLLGLWRPKELVDA